MRTVTVISLSDLFIFYVVLYSVFVTKKSDGTYLCAGKLGDWVKMASDKRAIAAPRRGRIASANTMLFQDVSRDVFKIMITINTCYRFVLSVSMWNNTLSRLQIQKYNTVLLPYDIIFNIVIKYLIERFYKITNNAFNDINDISC